MFSFRTGKGFPLHVYEKLLFFITISQMVDQYNIQF